MCRGPQICARGAPCSLVGPPRHSRHGAPAPRSPAPWADRYVSRLVNASTGAADWARESMFARVLGSTLCRQLQGSVSSAPAAWQSTVGESDACAPPSSPHASPIGWGGRSAAVPRPPPPSPGPPSGMAPAHRKIGAAIGPRDGGRRATAACAAAAAAAGRRLLPASRRRQRSLRPGAANADVLRRSTSARPAKEPTRKRSRPRRPRNVAHSPHPGPPAALRAARCVWGRPPRRPYRNTSARRREDHGGGSGRQDQGGEPGGGPGWR